MANVSREYKFGNEDTESELTITPLGAAIVEAMPDSKKKKRVNRRFTSHAECPVSIIFPNPVDVEAFYALRGIKVKGIRTL